jgi:Spy/CpxP family protein refolding chaperone
MKRISTMLVLLSAILATATVSASGMEKGCRGGYGRGFGPGPEGGHGRGMGFLERLDLTDAQWKQVEVLKDQTEDKLDPVHNQLDKLRNEMHTLWTESKPDQKKILATMKKMEPLREQIRTAHVELRLKVIALLTPAQNAERIKMMNRFEKRRERGRGFGGPPPAEDLD